MTGWSAEQPHLTGDDELMRRVKLDDAIAFDELYERYANRSYGLARTICSTAERAEEAVQDAFLGLWLSRARFDSELGTPQAWILTAVRNRSIDIYRANTRPDRLRAPDGCLGRTLAPESVEDDAERHHDTAHLRATLAHLPPLQREVIFLAFFGGLSHTEIAHRLEIPLGTVKGRMRLGLNKTRANLDRDAARS